MGKRLLTMTQMKEKLEQEAKYEAARVKYVTSLTPVSYASLTNGCGVSVSMIAKIGARDNWVLQRANYHKPNQASIKYLKDKYKGGDSKGAVRDGQEGDPLDTTTRSEMDSAVVELAHAKAIGGGQVRDYIEARGLELRKEDRDGGDTTPRLVISNHSIEAAASAVGLCLAAIGRALSVPDKSIDPAATMEVSI